MVDKKRSKSGSSKKQTSSKENWLLPLQTRKELKLRFKELSGPVVLEVFVDSNEKNPYNNITTQFCTDLAKLSEKITTNINRIGSEKSNKFEVVHSPSVLFNPEEYKIRYTGAPIGEEGKSFIATILLVSNGESGLSKESVKALDTLKEERHVMVFVTPDCPYCPGQVLNAFRACIEHPDLVSAECVGSVENIKLAKAYNVGAVPHTVINYTTLSRGLQPEAMFIRELVTLEPTQPPQGPEMGAHEHELEHTHEHGHDAAKAAIAVDLLILGAGPAGLTAGIYAERSGLRTIVLEKDMVGGQVAITPVVENYPGFTNIAGKKLMDLLEAQARGYVTVREGEEVHEIKVGKRIEAITNKNRYTGKAIILATGAGHRKLGVPGEEEYSGHGVSYCATCDGYFFKDNKVLMVGGGNSALTDALYLKNLGAKVAIVHRRDSFRAEKYLQQSVEREKLHIIWDSVVEEILGKDKKVTGVKLLNLKTKKTATHKVGGVFIAIGEDPNSKLAGELGITLDKGRFITVDRGCRTNIPRVYAAGDVTGGVRQIVTAVSEGATAALSAFQDITNPYWLNE